MTDQSHSNTVMDSPNTAPIAPLHCYTVALSQIVDDEQGELICDSPNSTQAHITPSQHWRQRHNDTAVSSDTHSDSTEHSQIAGDVSDSSDSSDVSDAIFNFRLDLLPETRGQDPPTSSTSSSAENPERLRSVESL